MGQGIDPCCLPCLQGETTFVISVVSLDDEAISVGLCVCGGGGGVRGECL